jgi:hypothetical protein
MYRPVLAALAISAGLPAPASPVRARGEIVSCQSDITLGADGVLSVRPNRVQP